MNADDLPAEKDVKLPLLSKVALWGAGALTLGWLVAAGYFAFYDHGTINLPEKLNEWGDFAAGVFAPIAFLWLVVAVMLQSTELREQRWELILTRKEFEHNRDVMKAQAEEAKNQAKYLHEQTEMLKTAQEYAEADRIFIVAVERIATRLRQYVGSGWNIYLIEDGKDGELRGTILDFKKDMYDGDDNILVIATTVQVLRTRLRELKQSHPDPHLKAEYGYDFQRVYRAVVSSAEKIAKLPPIFQEKADTLELGELEGHLTFIANHAGIKPFGPVPKGLSHFSKTSADKSPAEKEGEDQQPTG
jgi:hypothetical protein